ncbi:hypothetical protein FA13DRAFT_1735127 [Coprinellus micaceus]|uniref:F-box domain-containing protein n=1 Tax=Coprinellus micaceus TaxID=71717 RepID=A0A4Y7T4G3_COPMI|nr:hypothetical protein FA13DRAFT_1735127 [Coprinellus micaceus]
MALSGGVRPGTKLSRSASPAPSKASLINHHDVLVLIFGHFSLKERKQLRDLALVCKAFSEPALDYLWAVLDCLTPLLKLHPALKVIDNSHFYLGPINSSGAHRFYEYARRVRHLRLADGKDEETHRISLAGFAWLGQQLQGAPLMPGLKELHFSNPNRDSVHMGLLPLVLSCSVRSASFDGQFLSAGVFRSYALPLVCSAASALKNLSLSDTTSISAPEIWDRLPTIASNIRLQHLKIDFPFNATLNPALLGKFGRIFETLTSLYLDVHTASHSPSGDVMEPGLLPLLTSLHLVNRCEATLCQCYPPFLLQRVTSITFHSSRHILEARAFQATTETLCGSKSLRRLEISAAALNDKHVISPSALSTLLKNLDLEELIVNGECMQSQTDLAGLDIIYIIDGGCRKDRQDSGVVLQKLTTPLLRRQPATSNGQRPPGPFPPISSLVYIARHGAGLKHISMAIDSSLVSTGGKESLQELLDSWKVPDVPSTLTHLEIADRRTSEKTFTPDEYRILARLLDTIFPNLESVKPIDFPAGQVKMNWNAHWELIEEHRQMRKALRILGTKYQH